MPEYHIECKTSGVGFTVELPLQRAVNIARETIRGEAGCNVLWLQPDNIRVAEVRHDTTWISSQHLANLINSTNSTKESESCE